MASDASSPANQDDQIAAADPPEPPPATAPLTAEDTDSALPPSFGWTHYAERLNGRFAMIGFAALLVLELLTGQDFFTWLGR